MISIIDLVGEDALYSKTVSWVSGIILHTNTNTDTDTDTGAVSWVWWSYGQEQPYDKSGLKKLEDFALSMSYFTYERRVYYDISSCTH